ncbi:MAG: hypothetical protein L0154_12810 [Chloroflexi bacterium]|nr:hypothetical protein [Chloroflexota bacterium]
MWETYTSIFNNVASGVAALVILYVALKGLTQWRRELGGKAQAELARKAVLAAFHFQSEFANARGPVGWSSEYSDRPKEPDESPKVAQVRNEQYARLKRLEKAQKWLNELQELSWEAEVTLGQNFDELIKPYREAFREVYFAILDRTDEDRQSLSERKENMRKMYSVGTDDIAESVNQATSELKKLLKPYLPLPHNHQRNWLYKLVDRVMPN